MLKKLQDFFTMFCVSMSGAMAYISSGVLQRIAVSKPVDEKKIKASPRKSLSIVTSPMNGPGCDGVLLTSTPRAEKRSFLNQLHELLSPNSFVRQSKIHIDKIRPLFSPMKCVEDAFRPPRIRKSFGEMLPTDVKPPPPIVMTKLQAEQESNMKEMKEVALRGLVETIIFDVVSSALNEDGYMYTDPLYDTEHMAMKNVASDFVTGTFDAMKRTAFPQLATMIVREMSAPTADKYPVKKDFVDLPDGDQPITENKAINHRLHAHLFTAKILIRYIVMPMFVRGFAHTAPALAFHLAETELKIMEHSHHFF